MFHFNAQSFLYDTTGKRKYLTQNEKERFLYEASQGDDLEFLFFKMLAYTGARLSEVNNLRVMHFDFEEKLVIIECLKKRKKGIFRHVPLPESLLSHIKNHAQLLNHDDKIWKWSRRTVTRRVKVIMNQAGINGPQSSSKGLRHGFAVQSIQRDIPITLVQRWLGHSSIQTTSIYLQVGGKEERAFAERNW